MADSQPDAIPVLAIKPFQKFFNMGSAHVEQINGILSE
jgi:hypothetical protein